MLININYKYIIILFSLQKKINKAGVIGVIVIDGIDCSLDIFAKSSYTVSYAVYDTTNDDTDDDDSDDSRGIYIWGS